MINKQGVSIDMTNSSELSNVIILYIYIYVFVESSSCYSNIQNNLMYHYY